MNICNNHLFGLIIIFAVLAVGMILSIIKEERESHQIVTIEKIKEKDYLICQDCKHDVTGEIIG